MGGDSKPSGAREILKDEKYLHCTRCALCTYTCPIYRELLVETDAPRGKVALIRAIAEGRLDLSERYAEKIYRCLQCGACTAFCPSGVEVDKLMEAARAELVEEGLLPPPLIQLNETIVTYGNVSGDDNSQRLVWTENLERAPNGVAAVGDIEVVYLVGCVSSFIIHPGCCNVTLSSQFCSSKHTLGSFITYTASSTVVPKEVLLTFSNSVSIISILFL